MKLAMNRLLAVNVLFIIFHFVLCNEVPSCDVKEIFIQKDICELGDGSLADDPVFILYSVNPVEGFNLRRDVYLRMAIFLKKLKSLEKYSSAQLVLSPFHHLYHWKSHFRQSNIFWNHFFDLESLKLFTDVIDMWEFFDIIHKSSGRQTVDISEVYVLQQYDSMFENGVFIDKFDEVSCQRNEYDNYHFLEYFNITEKAITCLRFQGSASLLIRVLEEYKAKHHRPGTPRVVLFAVSLKECTHVKSVNMKTFSTAR